MYNETSIQTCDNGQDYSNVSKFGYDFADFASTYSHPKCPGKYEYTCTLGTFFYVNFKIEIYHSIIHFDNILTILAHCEQATFDIGIQTYDALSKISIGDDEDTRDISIYYATTGVRVSTTSALIDLATFISNVGGNLGLFVEFSILGGLFFIYDFLAVRFAQ